MAAAPSVPVAFKLCSTTPVIKALHVLCKANVPDQLASGPKSIPELALATDLKEDHLYRLLRAVESHGLFSRTSSGAWENNSESEFLLKDAPNSYRTFVNHVAHESYLGCINMFEACNKDASSEQISWKLYSGGEDYWTWLNRPEHTEYLENFSAFMVDNTAKEMGPVLKDYDWSKFDNLTVADIGGGCGQLLLEILKIQPKIKPLVFDAEPVIEEAKEYWKGSTADVTLCGGDFFKSVPEADAFLLKHILHDWNDDACVKILKVIYERAKENGSRLLILEVVFEDERPLSPWQAFLDLEMMTMVGGKERTANEFEILLEKAGFKIDGIFATGGGLSIIEAIPIV